MKNFTTEFDERKHHLWSLPSMNKEATQGHGIQAYAVLNESSK